MFRSCSWGNHNEGDNEMSEIRKCRMIVVGEIEIIEGTDMKVAEGELKKDLEDIDIKVEDVVLMERKV